MQVTAFVFVVWGFAAQVVKPWTIPDGAPHGVYSVEVFPDGTEVHTRLADISKLPNRQTHDLISEETTKTTLDTNTDNADDVVWDLVCWTNEGLEDLDHSTTDAANAALDAQCGDGTEVKRGYDFYSIYGCVVAYFCRFTYDKDPNPHQNCSAAERRMTSELITQKCGRYKPGWVVQNYKPEYHKEHRVAYGYESYCTHAGHNFCGRGVDGRRG